MSAQYTPGPWHAGEQREVSAWVEIHADGRGGMPVSYATPATVRPDNADRAETRANARLIAAAPDLLNALSVLADAAEEIGIPCDAARAAIAKATGETA